MMPQPSALPPITWDGLDLNPGHLPDGLTTIVVEDCTGWWDTPAFDGHDVALDLADGAMYGPKVMAAREITLTGAAVGPRPDLLEFRDQLAMRAAAREPSVIILTDPPTGRAYTADVRCGADALRVSFITGAAVRWQVAMTAADPRLYELNWRRATLTTPSPAETGRHYPRSYPWQYGGASLPNSALLTNPGNVPAPVWAVATGDLSGAGWPLATNWSLTDGTGVITIRPLAAGETLYLDTETLVAEAPGGASRASMIVAGSVPLTIPPRSSVVWRMLAYAGTGQVDLAWRGAWA
jgi:hypothetical protein